MPFSGIFYNSWKIGDGLHVYFFKNKYKCSLGSLYAKFPGFQYCTSSYIFSSIPLFFGNYWHKE